MADETDVPISFTANIESLQKGIDAGESLCESLVQKINQLNSALSSLGTAGAPALIAELEQVKAELSAAQSLTQGLATQMQTLGGSGGSGGGIQNFINQTHRLGEELNSAKEASQSFTSVLGLQGATTAEVANQTANLGSQVQTISNAGFSKMAGELAGVRTNTLSAADSARVFQSEWAGVKSQMVSVPGREFFQNFNSSIRQSSGDIKSAKDSFNTFVNQGVVPAGNAMGGLTLRTSGVTREVIVLAHEMVSGRFSRIPGSLMVLTEYLGGLSLGMWGVVGAVGIAAGALGFMAYRAIELSNAVKNIEIGATFVGNAQLSNKAIESTITELAKMHNVTRETAEGVVGEFARMRGMSEQDLRAVSIATGELARAQGVDAKQAASQLSRIMNEENTSLRSLMSSFPGATEEQLQNALQVMRTGNENQRYAAVLTLVQDNLDATKESQIRATSAMFDSFSNFVKYSGALYLGMSYQQIENAIIQENTDKWNANAAAVRADAAARASKPLTSEQILRAADLASESENPQDAQMKTTSKHISELSTAIDELKHKKIITDEDTAKIAEYNKSLKEAEGHLAQLKHAQEKKTDFGTNLEGQQLIRQTREINAEITANDKISAAEQHQIVAANWQKLLDEGHLTAQQQIEVRREMWTATGQADKAGSRLTMEEARVRTTQIQAQENKSSSEKLSQIVAVWAAVRDNDKLGFAERLQAEKEYWSASAQLVRANESQAAGIAKSDADTARELSRLKIANRRAELNQEYSLTREAADERTNSLIKLVEEERDLDIQALDDLEKTLNKGDAAFEEAENKKKIIAQKTENDIAQIRRDAAAADRRNAQQNVTDWRAAVGEIQSAENQMITGIIQRRLNAKQILGNMIDSFLTKELEADAQYLTKHILLSNEELAADKTREQAGFLWKLLFEEKKTAATVAGEATRTATKEAAKTAGSAADVAAGSAQIMNDASKAAAGAYAAVAGIPIVGPILAPIAAGTAFAAVAAFDTLTSLDVGAWRVPHDMPAYIHEGESVVPKNFADGLRDHGQIGGGGNRAGGQDRVQLHYNPEINAPAQKSLHELLRGESSTMVKYLNGLIRDGALNI